MTDARTIVHALGGRMFAGYGMACCPVHADRTPSLRVIDGHTAPLFKCFAGCDSSDIAAALRERLLLSTNNDAATLDERKLRDQRRSAEVARQQAERLERARNIWNEARSIEDTLVVDYLAARAVRPPWPASLRFHPACFCAEIEDVLPAMIGGIKRDDEFVGVHRTYLSPDGGKANVKAQKVTLGPIKGGAVRLSAPAGTLVVAEGLETGLSVRDALVGRDVAVWSAISATNLSTLTLPTWAREIVVAADNDAPGLNAAKMLAERCADRGLVCRLMLPPDRHNDFNDVAQAEAAR